MSMYTTTGETAYQDWQAQYDKACRERLERYSQLPLVYDVEITDKPMGCCGMLMAHNFFSRVYRGNSRNDYLDFGTKTDEHYREDFERVINAQRSNARACAMVSLASDQTKAIEIAKSMGFQEIFYFKNPNSGNTVYILVHMEDLNRDYEDDEDEED